MKLRVRDLTVSLLAGRCATETLEKPYVSEDYTFPPERCQATVDEVEKKNKWTEEAIQPVCEREMKWRKCDFFAEALSLASSHNDFNSTDFCSNMEEAHFCSQTMDKVLSSTPVSDLAFGECSRATPKKTDSYCRKFQRMFGYAVQSEDLDTIRACYMIESYSNMTDEEPTTTPEPKGAPPPVPTNQRIIVTSSKDLSNYGHGRAGENTIPGSVHFGREAIVVKPAPLTNMGDGKGRFTNGSSAPASAAVPAPAPAPAPGRAGEQPPPKPKAKGTIVVEPVPQKEAGDVVQFWAGEPVQLAGESRATARAPPAIPRVVLQKPAPAAVARQPATVPQAAPAPPTPAQQSSVEQPSGFLTALAGSLMGMRMPNSPQPAQQQVAAAPVLQAKVEAPAAAAAEEDAPLVPALKAAPTHQEAVAAAQAAQLVQAYKGKIVQELHSMFTSHPDTKSAPPHVASHANGALLSKATAQLHTKAATTQAKQPAVAKVASKVKKEDTPKDHKGDFFLGSFVS